MQHLFVADPDFSALHFFMCMKSVIKALVGATDVEVNQSVVLRWGRREGKRRLGARCDLSTLIRYEGEPARGSCREMPARGPEQPLRVLRSSRG